VDKFRWYDWVIIFLIADISSAIIVTVMTGAIELSFMLPMLIIVWLSYEDFRVRQNDKERK
jgi:hypothetical protein